MSVATLLEILTWLSVPGGIFGSVQAVAAARVLVRKGCGSGAATAAITLHAGGIG